MIPDALFYFVLWAPVGFGIGLCVGASLWRPIERQTVEQEES